MKMNLRGRNWCVLLLAVVAGAGLAGQALAQTMVGDTVEWWSQPQLTGVPALNGLAAVTSPAHEFEADIVGTVVYTLNVEATSIRLDVASDFFSPYFASGFDPTYLEIRDLDFIGEPNRYIVGIEVTHSGANGSISVHQGSPLGWPLFSADNVSFTADSVRISIGGYDFMAGGFVDVNLITAVPEPGTAALLGLTGLLLGRRRHAVSHG